MKKIKTLAAIVMAMGLGCVAIKVFLPDRWDQGMAVIDKFLAEEEASGDGFGTEMYPETVGHQLVSGEGDPPRASSEDPRFNSPEDEEYRFWEKTGGKP